MTTLTKPIFPNQYQHPSGSYATDSSANVQALHIWRSFVSLGDSKHVGESIRSDEDTYARFDTPHQSVPDPWLLTQWRVDVGWHRPVDRSEVPQEIFSKKNSPAESQVQEPRLNQLLAEAAHDIRSPIAVAQQIISSVTKRANDTGIWTQAETSLLAEAITEYSAAGASADIDRAEAMLRQIGAGSKKARPKRPAFGWDALTPTEMAVTELAAEGLTNPEIGTRLFVSRRTVETHLSHVFRKLDVATRTQLASEFARRSNT